MAEHLDSFKEYPLVTLDLRIRSFPPVRLVIKMIRPLVRVKQILSRFL